MVLGTISFLFGVILLQQFSSLPEIRWYWAGFLILLIPALPSYSRYLFFLFLGFLWALVRAHLVLDVALPADLQGRDIYLTGVISSIPQKDNHKTRFEFDIETASIATPLTNGQHKDPVQLIPHPELSRLGKVRLSWYHRKSRKKQISNKTIELKAGQRWQFWSRLKQPHGFMNPGGSDYEGWLYQKKIRATGYVRIDPKRQQTAKLIHQRASNYPILVARQKLYDKLKTSIVSTEHGGILLALAMGERSHISQLQWQVFRTTGTSHLVAISGLHIGLLAGFIFYLVRRVWPYCGSAALHLASPRAAAIVALIVAAGYAALSGFAVPAQRALIMLTIVMLSVFRMRKVRSMNVLSWALLAVLLLDPIAVLSAGFWLSFAAVSIIILVAFARINHLQNRFNWIRLQWRISLVLIPLLLFLFQQASLVSPVSNFIAIPVISFVVVPMVLIGSTIALFFQEISILLFLAADTVLNLLWLILSYLAALPWSQWLAVKPDLVPLLLACLGVFLIAGPRGWPVKYWGLFLLVPLIWPKESLLNHGEAEITLLDVGQGLASVIKTKHHALVFDTGAKFSDHFDAGAAVVLPFLQTHRIKQLDMLILSHKDNDHRGGYTSITNEIEIRKVLSSHQELGSLPCFAGQTWQWDGVYFEILNPSSSIKLIKRNNASCVLSIKAGEETMLMSADIEKKAEQELVRVQKGKLKSHYLIVPHHGSNTSSSAAFLDAVQPEYAFIPVGYRNPYRMPHAAVLQRYRERKIEILKTSSSGAITVKLGQKSNTLKPLEYRKKVHKYWNSHH